MSDGGTGGPGQMWPGKEMTETPRMDAIWSLYCTGSNPDAVWKMIGDLERELAVAQKNYQFMVDRATNEKLDGYRELGAKAAAAEERAEKAERGLAKARKDAERYIWWTQNYGAVYDGPGTLKLYTVVPYGKFLTKELFDAAIDAARRET